MTVAHKRIVEPGDAVFVGEGHDECRLLSHLTTEWKRLPFIEALKNEKGISSRDHFRALTQNAWMRHAYSIGLLVDAEASRDKATSEVAGMFAHAELPFPPRPNKVVVALKGKSRLRVAFLINPPRCHSGAIETLFVPQIIKSPISDCLDDLLECYESKGLIISTAKSRARRDKILVRTFLAHHRPHNTGLKVALDDAILSCNFPEFKPVKKFIAILKPPSAPLYDD